MEINVWDFVLQRIRSSNLDRVGVCVIGTDDCFSKQFCRRDCQNPGTGSYIKEAATLEIFFNRQETKPRRFMRAGTKRHARFDTDDYSVLVMWNIRPGRSNNQTFT